MSGPSPANRRRPSVVEFLGLRRNFVALLSMVVDLEHLERQFEVYAALYAWCRLQVARER